MKKTMMYILVGAALIIGIALIVKSVKKKKIEKAENSQTINKTEQNPYSDMRKMAFSVTYEQLGLNDIQKDQVYGIVSEMDIDGGSVTIITYLTGDASIYLSSGGGFIGAGQHESVQKITTEYVKSGQQYLENADKSENTDLPKSGMANFNFLTETGIYRVTQSLRELESGKSKFSNLFIKLNEVISEVRIKSEQ